MNYSGNIAGTFLVVVVVVVVVVVDDHSWKASWGSCFDCFAGRLSFSL